MQKVRKEIINAIENPESENNLGSLCWWGTLKAKVKPVDLSTLATNNGLPLSLLPKDPTPSRAFRRAAKACESLEKGWKVELLTDSATEITYGVLEREINKDEIRAAWNQVARISYFPGTQTISSDNRNHDAVKEIESNLVHFQTYWVTMDITEMVNRVMASVRALPMTISKQNSRFVLAPSIETINALAATLKSIKGCDFMMVNVPADKISRDSMNRVAETEFTINIDDAEKSMVALKQAIEDARKDDNGKTGPREATIKKRIAEYQQLQAQIEMYAQVLTFRSDDLINRLGDVQNEMRKLLLGQ